MKRGIYDLLILSALIYLIHAFIRMDLNALNWHSQERTAVIVVSITSWIMYTVLKKIKPS